MSHELIRLQVKDGSSLALTKNHPILTKHGWVMAKDTNQEDYIYMDDKNFHAICSIQNIEEEVHVCMLCVEGEHGFYANKFYIGDIEQDGYIHKQTFKALPLNAQLRDELRKLSKGEW